MDLRRQIAIIRKWLWFFVLSVLLAAGPAFVISSNILPKAYEAKATLIVGQSLSAVNPDYSQLLASQRLSVTYAAVATKRPILEAVVKQLDLVVTPDELSKHVQADAPVDSTLFTISAQDVDPTRAATVANAVAEQLIAVSPAIQGRQTEFQASIDAALKTTQEQINSIQAQVATLRGLPKRTDTQDADLKTREGTLASLLSTYAALLSFSSGGASNVLTLIEPAIPPSDPISPTPLLNTLLAAGLGLLVAAGVVAVAEQLNDRVRGA
jgi:succinoglycan biosynthesis transport protein ExoP